MAILDAIAAEDVAGALTGLAHLLESGHDARRVAEDLLRSLRDAFLLTAARGEVPIDAPEDERERLSAVGEVLGNALLVRGLETLGQAVVDMRGTDAADPRLVLEIALVRLARRDTGGPLQVLADRVDRLEQRLANVAAGGRRRGPASTEEPKAAPKTPARSPRSARSSRRRSRRSKPR